MRPARRIPIVDAVAPPERLAAFRALVGIFVMTYVLIRLPVYLGLRNRPDGAFEGIGVLSVLTEAPSHTLVVSVLIVTLATGVAFTIGAWFRITAPVFALGLLFLGTVRSSFGQLLHFENLFVIHVMVLALSPAADAWAISPGRRGSARTAANGGEPSTRYGFPLAVASLVTVLTYVVAGIAKLRYGGLEWMFGDTLGNHVAYSASRQDLIGASAPPLAALAVSHAWIFPPLAVGSVLIELAAPLALLGRRSRWLWAGLAWTMHLGILTTMLVGFPYPLFGVAFAPLFPLEKLRHPFGGLQTRIGSRRRAGRLSPMLPTSPAERRRSSR